jgi:acyl carrier protein
MSSHSLELEISKKLNAFLQDTLLVSFDQKVTKDSNLIESGFMDSFAIVQLVSFLEQTFKIRLTEAEMTSRDLAIPSKIEELLLRKINQ